MSDKSKLIHELEWALTLVKYSPKPNYDKVAEHFDNAQQQLKILNIPVVSNNEVPLFCDACERPKRNQTICKCPNHKTWVQ
jgi:hypothetical protein